MTAATPDIIELGTLESGEPQPTGPSFSPRMRRVLMNVAATLLCLLALTASVVSEPGLNVPLWTGTVTLNGFNLGGDVLFSSRLDGRAIIARDLRTGKRLWEFEVPDIAESGTDLGGGVTAVTSRPARSTGGMPLGVTTFVTTRTGEPRGEIGAVFGQPSIGGLPLVMVSGRADCPSVEMNCLTIHGWDLATGVVAWQTDLPADTYTNYSSRGELIDGLVVVGRDGTVQLRDLASGSVLTSVRLPEVAEYAQVLLLGGVLLTVAPVGDRLILNGYERPSLTRIWSTTVPVPPGVGNEGPSVWISECGTDVCAHVDGGDVRLVDPATGTVKAQTELEVFSRIGNGVFLAGPRGQPPAGGARVPTGGLVLDSSLRVIDHLDVTDQVWWRDNGNRALLTRTGKNWTDFIEVDEHGTKRVLGSVSGTGLTCDARGRYLACADSAGVLRVWRLPR